MSNSKQLFEQAQHLMPGGVNSPVRAFRGVGGTPIFMKHANGAYLFDAENNRYIDYVGAWGPAILGHADPDVVHAVQRAAANGLAFGTPCKLEIELAELIKTSMPNIEQVRMVNSGTEATMTAIRLARAITSRDKIIKFEGCYHGHSDSLLSKAGSGALTLGVPSSPGVPNSIAEHTLNATFNDLQSVEKLFEQHNIAAIIVEPIAGNMNCVLPKDGFLQGLRTLCDKHHSLLIFDEVMTGFRVALGSAQQYFNVKPDLTTLGKIIGGGLPVGAIAGAKPLMQQLAPTGPVYQAGTLSGSPIAMAAGIATLKKLLDKNPYKQLTKTTEKLTQGICTQANNHGIAMTCNTIGAMFGLFFTNAVVTNYEQATHCNIEHFKQFFHGMLAAGIYLAPSAFEAGFVSTQHSEQDINDTISTANEVFLRIKSKKHVTTD